MLPTCADVGRFFSKAFQIARLLADGCIQRHLRPIFSASRRTSPVIFTFYLLSRRREKKKGRAFRPGGGGSRAGVNTEQKGNTTGQRASPSVPPGVLHLYHNVAENPTSNP